VLLVRPTAAVAHDSAASLIRDMLRAERIATDTLIDLPGETNDPTFKGNTDEINADDAGIVGRTGKQGSVCNSFIFFFIDIFRERSRQSLHQAPPFRSAPRLAHVSGVPHSASPLFTRKRPLCTLTPSLTVLFAH
jgi:hypothetical protein